MFLGLGLTIHGQGGGGAASPLILKDRAGNNILDRAAATISTRV